MDKKEYARIIKLLGLNTQLPTKGNVPDPLLQPGDGSGPEMLQLGLGWQRSSPWTLEDHYNLCIEALANGASFEQADAYCQDNCGMTFGALYNFMQVFHNPMV